MGFVIRAQGWCVSGVQCMLGDIKATAVGCLHSGRTSLDRSDDSPAKRGSSGPMCMPPVPPMPPRKGSRRPPYPGGRNPGGTASLLPIILGGCAGRFGAAAQQTNGFKLKIKLRLNHLANRQHEVEMAKFGIGAGAWESLQGKRDNPLPSCLL